MIQLSTPTPTRSATLLLQNVTDGRTTV